MPVPPDDVPAWAHELLVAVPALRAARGAAREGAQVRVWRLLHAALFAAARAQAGRIAPVSQEDLEDLASTKASDLLARAEGGSWDPAPHPAHEVAGFVRRAARNGLVDLARKRSRECPPPENEEDWDVVLTDRSAGAPEDWVDAREFVSALESCVRALAPRSRDVWFLRACLERTSREIATLLGLSTANVDVLVMRARVALGECMRAKGHDAREGGSGAFGVLWAEWQDRQPMPGEDRA